MKNVLLLITLFLGFNKTISAQTFGYIHNYTNQMRSSVISHILVSQGVDGEYGIMNTSVDQGFAASLGQGSNHGSGKYTWQGFGLTSGVGVEVLKFVQFNVGHTFVNLKTKNDSLENLSGSRLSAESRFVFMAPVGNLEIGGGFIGSKLNYQRRLEQSTFYGSGYFYSLGVNYYLSSQLSVVGSGKVLTESLLRSSGSPVVKDMKSDLTAIGVGFRLWL